MGENHGKNGFKMCLKMSYLFKNDLFYFVTKVVNKVVKNRTK